MVPELWGNFSFNITSPWKQPAFGSGKTDCPFSILATLQWMSITQRALMMCNDSTQTSMEKGGSVRSQLARLCSVTHRLHYFLCRPLGPPEEAKHFYLSESTFLFRFYLFTFFRHPWMRHLQLQQPHVERAHSACKGTGRHTGQLIDTATFPNSSKEGWISQQLSILWCISGTALLSSTFMFGSKSSEEKMHYTDQHGQSR